MLLRFLLPFLLSMLALAPAAPAGAEVTRKKSIWGPIELAGVSQFPIYADLGAGIFQYSLGWHGTAERRPADPRDPADPAYRWPQEIDVAIQEGQRYGIDVSLVVLGSPRWANGGRRWPWAPNRARDYADFIAAATRRYPGVRFWQIWIEPTKSANFKPLVADRGKPLRGPGLRAPRLYSKMLDGAYAEIKRFDRSDKVIGGNTYTVGTVAPRNWIRALRMPSGRPPRMDLYGHNPFTLRSPSLKKPPLGHGFADFSDLDTLAGWLDRDLRQPGGRRLPIFISEMSLPTDHANHEFNFYLDRKTQARWISGMLRITRDWSRIYSFGYLGLYDDAERENGDQVERGLMDRQGQPKPGYAAFKNG